MVNTDQNDGQLLKQSWWHIEDEIEPADGRLVIRVQDVYIDKEEFTKNNSFYVYLGPYFVGFKARNKNSGTELSFIAIYPNSNNEGVEAEIKINLGSLQDWPEVKGENCLHIKIEYEYLNFWPSFEKRSTYYPGAKIPIETNNFSENSEVENDSSEKLVKELDYKIQLPSELFDRIKLIILPGYNGQFDMPGDSQGEISITVPLGMKILYGGKSTEITFYEGNIVPETDQVEMSYRKPHITYYNDKLKYHYIIDEISFDYVLDVINTNSNTNFLITYTVINDSKFFLIPILAIIVFSSVLFVDWTSLNWFYFIVILLSLTTLYLTLRKDKYQIPFNKLVVTLIVLSVPFLALKTSIMPHLLLILTIVIILEIPFICISLKTFLYLKKPI